MHKDIFCLGHAFFRVNENIWTRLCLCQLTFVSVKQSKSIPLSWRLRHSWSRECSPFPKSSPFILRLMIRRFSFGLVVILSPKYSFLWNYWRLSRMAWMVCQLAVKVSFLWSWTFWAHLKPNPVIFCCLGLLGKFVFMFLIEGSYLRFPFHLFGDWVVLWKNDGVIIRFRIDY